MKTKGLFAVSLIAMFAMGAANADIASKGYVDNLVDGRLTSISGSTEGTGNVVTAVSASGSTVTATKGITAEETKNKVTTVRATASATDTTYPSEKAVAVALEGKADVSDIPSEYVLKAATEEALGGVKSGGDITVSTAGAVTVNSATTADSATKATQDGSGNNIVNTYATKTELSDVSDVADAAQTAANNKVAKAQGSEAANKVLITDSTGNVTTGTVSSAMITDGTITNADISASAAIATSKISGLATVATSGSYNDLSNKPTIPAAVTVDSALSSTSTNPVQNKVINTALAAKADTADLAEVATSGSYNDLTDKPSIPSAYTLPAATSTALGGVKSGGDITVSTAGAVTVNSATTADSATKATQDGSGNNIVNTYATKAQITALDSTSSGTGAVVTGVSQTDGKVTVTKGNVKIPVGGESGTTYATIWVE